MTSLVNKPRPEYQEIYNALVTEKLKADNLYQIMRYFRGRGLVKVDLRRADTGAVYSDLFRILHEDMKLVYTGNDVPKWGPKPLNYKCSPEGIRNCRSAIRKLDSGLVETLNRLLATDTQAEEWIPEAKARKELELAGFWYDGRFTRAAYEFVQQRIGL